MRRVSVILAVLLATVVVGGSLGAATSSAIGTCNPGGGGDGSAASPFLIANATQLGVVSSTPNACANGGYRYLQTADIALTGVFTPIGPDSAPFNGVYDGGGHTITGLYVDQTAVGMFKGLFGILNGGTVRNLTLSGATIIGISPQYAIVAGYAHSGSLIENVTVIDSSVSSYGVSQNMGGIVGYLQASTIRNARVTGLSIAIATSNDNIGGIAGGMYNGAVIERSSADVSVSGSGYRVGGIAGYVSFNSTITDAYARGAVAGSNSVGGLVGTFISPGTSVITRSYSTVRPTATGVAGGFVARDSTPAATPAVASFWDTTASGQATSANGAVGKTTAELTSAATFSDAGWSIASGWDANRTWGICARANDGYPFLTGAYTAATEPCTDRTPAATASATPAATVASTTLTTRNARVVGNTIVSQVTLPAAGKVVQTGGVQLARVGYVDSEEDEYEYRFEPRATMLVACSTSRTVTAARVVTLRCPLNRRTLRYITKRAAVIRLITTFTPTSGTRLSSSTAVALPKRTLRPAATTAPDVTG